MIDRQDIRDAWQYVLLTAPPLIGALIGLRYAKLLSPLERLINFLSSTFVGALAGQVVGERLGLSIVEVALATVVLTSVSMEALAGIYALARAFAADPLALVSKAFDLWRGNKP